MDKLSQFLIRTTGAPAPTKTASAVVPIAEPNIFDKVAFAGVDFDSDNSFLKQFEGSPLMPQAVALAEQELALEQRQLQARMARAAQRSAENWDQECAERDGMRLQKAQLVLQLYKMKAMGQGAPTPPGQAIIGEPQPAAVMQQPPADPGAEKIATGTSTHEAAASGVSSHMGGGLSRAIEAGMTTQDPNAVPLVGAVPLAGPLYVGYRRGEAAGRGGEGVLRALGGGIVGGLAGGAVGSLAGTAGATLGGLAGGALGTHYATRGLLPQQAEKQAAHKKAGIEDRDYYKRDRPQGSAPGGNVFASPLVRHGLPALAGAIQGANSLPDSPVVGSIGGAMGGVGGTELGRQGGEYLATALTPSEYHHIASPIGQLVGSYIGYRSGAGLGIEGARAISGSNKEAALRAYARKLRSEA